MKQLLKYSSEIDWDYKISKSFSPLSSKKLLKIRDKNTNFKINTNTFKNKKVKKQKSNNYAQKGNIYYALLFVFVFGFLFFLTISISSAAPLRNRKNNKQTIYNLETSTKLVEKYLFSNINEFNEDHKNTYNQIKKIKYSKYRVKKNDSYDRIAKLFGLKLDTLLLVNNIKKINTLRPGDILIISNQDGRIISVRKNDSIFKIANRYGIKWEMIADTNDLKSSVIYTGMKLFIPRSNLTSYERSQLFGIDYVWPASGRISSYFGPRIDPFTGAYGFHSGIDIKNSAGTKVKSARDGKVIFVGWQKVYGNFIMIRHGNKIISTYGHLSKVIVKKGQNVLQGEYIGNIGSSGRSTGPHLHFEIRENGKLINPLKLLN